MAKKWYDFCNVRDSPHVVDPATGTYLPWQGEDRGNYYDAKTDANMHNKNAGHNAIVLETT